MGPAIHIFVNLLKIRDAGDNQAGRERGGGRQDSKEKNSSEDHAKARV